MLYFYSTIHSCSPDQLLLTMPFFVFVPGFLRASGRIEEGKQLCVRDLGVRRNCYGGRYASGRRCPQAQEWKASSSSGKAKRRPSSYSRPSATEADLRPTLAVFA